MAYGCKLSASPCDAASTTAAARSRDRRPACPTPCGACLPCPATANSPPFMLLDRLASLFAENFAAYCELGASVCVWHEGREVLSLADGFKDRAKTQLWEAETMVLVWSAT